MATKKYTVSFLPFRQFMCCCFFVAFAFLATAQPIDKGSIFSPKTKLAERTKQDAGLWKYTILPVLNLRADTTNENQFQAALWSISQYMLKNDTTRRIVDSLFAAYGNIGIDTRQNLMEVVYGLYPKTYLQKIKTIWPAEKNPKLIATMFAYMKKAGFTKTDSLNIISWINAELADGDSSHLFTPLKTLITTTAKQKNLPALTSLFANQQKLGCKIIYSFQRQNRDFSGIAIVQNADGSFVKDDNGQVKTFVQLARSASNLPYFITNGSTPQGIFRIDSTDISKNQLIGPTPNIQLRMPFEIPADSFFVQVNESVLTDEDYLQSYQSLLPESWKIPAMTESFYAGRAGRSAIIAHGTTINPTYFKKQPFYPATPTLGCLCAQEIWNPSTGKLLVSDQLEMVNGFLATPGADGYLMVINLDNKAANVSRAEIAAMVKAYENKARR